jgi:hypothetical protein
MLLWALALGPCPVAPTEKPISEHRAQQLAQLVRKRGLAWVGETTRLRGVSDAAAWLIDPQAPEPHEPLSRAHSGTVPGERPISPTGSG